MPEVPPFHGNISFNAQHSPMGAFMSFTCGHFGTRGGFGLQIGRPGNQNLYIGVKDGDRFADAPLKCLPFYEGAVTDEAARYDVEKKQAERKSAVVAYSKDQIKRYYGWATDRWVTQDFQFSIYTRFGEIADPATTSADEMRVRLLPAISAELFVDNTAGSSTKTAVFCIKPGETGVRLLDATGPAHWKSVGFALRRSWGVLARCEDGHSLAPLLRWSPEQGLTNVNSVHRLGNTPGFCIEVPPGQSRRITIVLGRYLDEIVTTRLEGRYLYTRYFGSLDDVLTFGMEQHYSIRDDAEKLDHELLNSGLSPDQQFLIAHSTRSYYGSTQLLDVAGQPFWVVNEGEYCMMNTLDLSVDHEFWELKQNPWVVRNLLDNFVRYYSYVDQVKAPKTGELKPGGISFCHDMGVHNNFSPFGHSAYELPNLTGCFSYMTQEQLCNWILIAACYVAKTDDVEWLRSRIHVVIACVESMDCRDDQREKTGHMRRDSTRCGSGQEITTYDSLDASLGKARNNLYITLKRWAAYLGLKRLLASRRIGICECRRYRSTICS